jgi:hypothetical protein
VTGREEKALRILERGWSKAHTIRRGYAGGWLAGRLTGPFRLIRADTPWELHGLLQDDWRARNRRVAGVLAGTRHLAAGGRDA